MDSYNSMLRRRVRRNSVRPSQGDKQESGVKRGTFLTKLANDRHWIFHLTTFSLIIVACVYFDERLPLPKGSGRSNRSTEFSERHARQILTSLVELGPRPSGSHACEVGATAVILDEVRKIRKMANESHIIDVDIQKPKGCFSLNFLTQFAMCYQNLTNIVVRLGDSRDRTTALLLNCHFDSVPASPGASDDAVGCAVMLEILRILSVSPDPLPHDVIFLFNGGEENILQAAHGFITQHPWRHNLRAFINLEGAGAGGREILFQISVRSSWILNLYLENVPYPHTSVIGHELFQSGILPAETDLRMFRDFGRLSGVDMAFVKNGYVYHNEFDKVEFISDGSIQRAGENVLATIRAVLASPCMASVCVNGERHDVFFDILGLISFSYSFDLAYSINMTVCVIVFAIFYLSIKSAHDLSQHTPASEPWIRCYSSSYISRALFSYVAAMIACVFTCIVIEVVIKRTDSTLAWYGRPNAIIGLYVVPAVLAQLMVHHVRAHMGRRRHKLNDLQTEQCTFNVGMLILAILLFTFTVTKFRSSYYLTYILMFKLTRFPLLWLLRRINVHYDFATLLFIAHSLAVSPGYVFVVYGFVELRSLIVPILGRVGPLLDAERVIALFGMITAWLVAIIMAPLVYYSNRMRWMRVLCGFSVVYMLMVILTPYGTPFIYDLTGPRLRRLHIQHFSRVTRVFNSTEEKKESWLWFYPLDRRGVADLPRYDVVAGSAKPTCKTVNPFCDLPYYIPVNHIFPPAYSLVKPMTNFPPFTVTSNIIVVNRTVELGRRIVNVNITFEGTDHVTVFITPVEPWVLDRWELDAAIAEGSPTHFLSLNCGHSPCRWSFQMAFYSEVENDGIRVATVAAASRHVHGDDRYSDELKEIIKKIHDDREASLLDWRLWRSRMTVEAWTTDIVVMNL